MFLDTSPVYKNVAIVIVCVFSFVLVLFAACNEWTVHLSNVRLTISHVKQPLDSPPVTLATFDTFSNDVG